MAAISGDIKCVMLPGPCLPMKFRFEVEAQRAPGGTRSPFMARHMEQPGMRNLMPASLNILSSPSFWHWVYTGSDPGTIKAFTWELIFFPSKILAASLRSSILPFVQLPMKT